MKRSQRKEGILIIATGMLLLSILLMLIIIPGVFTRSLPNENNPGAVIGMSVLIIFRLLIIIWYISLIKKIRRDVETRNTGYIVIGILLIVFGLINSDGAFAFLNDKNLLYVSYLLFTSVFCDLVASILTFAAIFFKSQKN